MGGGEGDNNENVNHYSLNYFRNGHIHEQLPLRLMCLQTYEEFSPGIALDHVANGYNDECINILQCKYS